MNISSTECAKVYGKPMNLRYRDYYSRCRVKNREKNQWTECKTIAKRGKGCKKPLRKLDDNCIYATTEGQDGRVKVVNFPAHTIALFLLRKKQITFPCHLEVKPEISAKLQKGY